ncbi:MAG: hypothetical protein OHK0029_08500 [Armatimonadaceae bacterium]
MPGAITRSVPQPRVQRRNHSSKSVPRSAFVAYRVSSAFVSVILAVLLAVVAATGWFESPCKPLLLLPLVLAAVRFGIVGAISAYLVILAVLIVGTLIVQATFTGSAVLIEGFTALAVALLVGYYAERSAHAARTAEVRARRTEQQMTEIQWYNDTTAMMESLHDLEPMLAVVLIRLNELIPCDFALVYFRHEDSAAFHLSQAMGLPVAVEPLHQIVVPEAFVTRSGFDAQMVADTERCDPALEYLKEINPQARSLMIAPLRSVNDLFGVLIIGSHRPEAYSENHRKQFTRLARHMVYPLQRVRLHAMASTDVMTGLYNHRAFRKRLQSEIERTQRYNRPLSLLLLDIDHFKAVNDHHGHLVGDTVLAHLGRHIQKLVRTTDYPARYGGEEIAILCPETEAQEAYQLAERIRLSIAEKPFVVGLEKMIPITVSIGVASLPQDADDERTLVQITDAALYSAKAKGRNRTCYAQETDLSSLLTLL